VHISPAYSDYGYYPDMNVDVGVSQILDAIANHKPEKDIEKNEQFLKGFSIYNAGVQSEYGRLLSLVINAQ
jgi:hypothetical protein